MSFPLVCSLPCMSPPYVCMSSFVCMVNTFFRVSLRVSLLISLRVSRHMSLRVSGRVSLCVPPCVPPWIRPCPAVCPSVSSCVCPSECPSAYVQPYFCVPPTLPPYVPPYVPPYAPLYVPSVCLSVCPSVMSLYVCSSVCLTFRYECSLLVTFLYISPCLFVLPSPSVCFCVPLRVPRCIRASWSCRCGGGSFQPEPSTCFIGPVNQFGSGTSVCGTGSCSCGFSA